MYNFDLLRCFSQINSDETCYDPCRLLSACEVLRSLELVQLSKSVQLAVLFLQRTPANFKKPPDGTVKWQQPSHTSWQKVFQVLEGLMFNKG